MILQACALIVELGFDDKRAASSALTRAHFEYQHNKTMRYPICMAGENACPPEDCGGFPGFEELKETIRGPKNSEYEEMMAWLGGAYDPRSFDPNRINRDMLWTIDWTAEPNDQGLYLPFSGLDRDEEDVHFS